MQEGGLRTKGITKSTRPGEPLISVVTVVYNGAATLEQTIRSVLSQTYGNVEYVIIDGGSTDGTLDIIRKHEDEIDLWQSEPDGGIYDAMNKGIAVATGEWINFMNSGDTFADESSIERIRGLSQDIIYGDVYMKNGTALAERRQKDRFRYFFFSRDCMICHQSIFARKSTFDGNLFDTRYKMVADRLWLKRCIEDKKCSYVHIKHPVCIYDVSGLSSDMSSLLSESIKFTKNEYGYPGVIYLLIVRIVYGCYTFLLRSCHKSP